MTTLTDERSTIDGMKKRSFSSLFKYTAGALAVWTALVALSLILNVANERRQTMELAKKEARTSLNRDRAFRLWLTMRGGVYVPLDSLQPNPFLSHVPDRDVVTTKGNRLTLVNPGYLLRQVMQDFSTLYGLQVCIKSSRPRNPANIADEWEKKALSAFKENNDEVLEFVEINNEPYLRLMQPMIAKKACLKCHASRGYKEGDFLGGLSVALPMESYRLMERKVQITLALTHLGIWVLGVASIVFASSKGKLRIREHLNWEEKLMQSKEELRSLTQHIQCVREQERTRIARDIHDELGQVLTALNMDLSWLQKRLTKEQASLIEKTILMSSTINSAIQAVKRIYSELRPGILDSLGLTAAMEWLASDFETRSSIRCTVTTNPEDIDVDDALSTAFFRVFQETLTNVARHAKATKVDVSLEEKDSELIMTVQDNGIGIDRTLIHAPRSFGLIGARERIYNFGGTVEIEGVEGRGTTIRVTVPRHRSGAHA